MMTIDRTHICRVFAAYAARYDDTNALHFLLPIVILHG